MLKEILLQGAAQLGLSLDASALQGYETYFTLLEERGKVMNLTAITGQEDVARLHFLDSLALTTLAQLDGKTVIDIGSGAGFPGLPLKLALPGLELTMLDALQKRIRFLEEVTAAVGCDARCVHARAEEQALLPDWRDSFDFAMSRAVARLNLLCELCLPFVKVGGSFIAMKGAGSDEEIEEAAGAIRKLGGRIRRIADYAVPTTDITHRAVLIEKVSPTPKGYPRKFAKIQKAPL